MTSKQVAFLLADLGVTKTHSRPHVSNDNRLSEAAFNTLNYRNDLPERFGSDVDARGFCGDAGTTRSTITPGSSCSPRPMSTKAPVKSAWPRDGDDGSRLLRQAGTVRPRCAEGGPAPGGGVNQLAGDPAREAGDSAVISDENCLTLIGMFRTARWRGPQASLPLCANKVPERG